MRISSVAPVLIASAVLLFAACEIDPEVDLEPFDLVEPADNAVIALDSGVPLFVDFEPTEAPPFLRNYDITYHLVFGAVNADLTNESKRMVGPVVGGRSVNSGDVKVDFTGAELTEVQLRSFANSLGYEVGETARVQWAIRATMTSLRFEGEQYSSTSRVLEYDVTPLSN